MTSSRETAVDAFRISRDRSAFRLPNGRDRPSLALLRRYARKERCPYCDAAISVDAFKCPDSRTSQSNR